MPLNYEKILFLLVSDFYLWLTSCRHINTDQIYKKIHKTKSIFLSGRGRCLADFKEKLNFSYFFGNGIRKKCSLSIYYLSFYMVIISKNSNFYWKQ